MRELQIVPGGRTSARGTDSSIGNSRHVELLEVAGSSGMGARTNRKLVVQECVPPRSSCTGMSTLGK
jgi:hypothetical protein